MNVLVTQIIVITPEGNVSTTLGHFHVYVMMDTVEMALIVSVSTSHFVFCRRQYTVTKYRKFMSFTFKIAVYSSCDLTEFAWSESLVIIHNINLVFFGLNVR